MDDSDGVGGRPQRHVRGRYGLRSSTPYQRPPSGEVRRTVAEDAPLPVSTATPVGEAQAIPSRPSSSWAARMLTPFKAVANQVSSLTFRGSGSSPTSSLPADEVINIQPDSSSPDQGLQAAEDEPSPLDQPGAASGRAPANLSAQPAPSSSQADGTLAPRLGRPPLKRPASAAAPAAVPPRPGTAPHSVQSPPGSPSSALAQFLRGPAPQLPARDGSYWQGTRNVRSSSGEDPPLAARHGVLCRPEHGTPPPWLNRGSRAGLDLDNSFAAAKSPSQHSPGGPDAPQGGYLRPASLRSSSLAPFPSWAGPSRFQQQPPGSGAASSAAAPHAPAPAAKLPPPAWQPMRSQHPLASPQPAAAARGAKRVRLDPSAGRRTPSAGSGRSLIGAGIAGTPPGGLNSPGGSSRTGAAGSSHTRVLTPARSNRSVPLLQRRRQGETPTPVPSRLAITSGPSPQAAPPQAAAALTPAAARIQQALDGLDWRSPKAPVGSPFQPRPLGAARDKAAQPPPPSASLLRQPRGATAQSSPSAFAFGPAASQGEATPSLGQPSAPAAAPTLAANPWAETKRQLDWDQGPGSRDSLEQPPSDSAPTPTPAARSKEQEPASSSPHLKLGRSTTEPAAPQPKAGTPTPPQPDARAAPSAQPGFTFRQPWDCSREAAAAPPPKTLPNSFAFTAPAKAAFSPDPPAKQAKPAGSGPLSVGGVGDKKAQGAANASLLFGVQPAASLPAASLGAFNFPISGSGPGAPAAAQKAPPAFGKLLAAEAPAPSQPIATASGAVPAITAAKPFSTAAGSEGLVVPAMTAAKPFSTAAGSEGLVGFSLTPSGPPSVSPQFGAAAALSTSSGLPRPIAGQAIAEGSALAKIPFPAATTPAKQQAEQANEQAKSAASQPLPSDEEDGDVAEDMASKRAQLDAPASVSAEPAQAALALPALPALPNGPAAKPEPGATADAWASKRKRGPDGGVDDGKEEAAAKSAKLIPQAGPAPVKVEQPDGQAGGARPGPQSGAQADGLLKLDSLPSAGFPFNAPQKMSGGFGQPPGSNAASSGLTFAFGSQAHGSGPPLSFISQPPANSAAAPPAAAPEGGLLAFLQKSTAAAPAPDASTAAASSVGLPSVEAKGPSLPHLLPPAAQQASTQPAASGTGSGPPHPLAAAMAALPQQRAEAAPAPAPSLKAPAWTASQPVGGPRPADASNGPQPVDAFSIPTGGPAIPVSSLPAVSGDQGGVPSFLDTTVCFGHSSSPAPANFIFGATAADKQLDTAAQLRSQWQPPVAAPPPLTTPSPGGGDEMMQTSPGAEKPLDNTFSPGMVGSAAPSNQQPPLMNGFIPQPGNASAFGGFGSAFQSGGSGFRPPAGTSNGPFPVPGSFTGQTAAAASAWQAASHLSGSIAGGPAPSGTPPVFGAQGAFGGPSQPSALFGSNPNNGAGPPGGQMPTASNTGPAPQAVEGAMSLGAVSTTQNSKRRRQVRKPR